MSRWLEVSILLFQSKDDVFVWRLVRYFLLTAAIATVWVDLEIVRECTFVLLAGNRLVLESGMGDLVGSLLDSYSLYRL